MRCMVHGNGLYVDGKYVPVSPRTVDILMRIHAPSDRERMLEIPPTLARKMIGAEREMAIQLLENELEKSTAW